MTLNCFYHIVYFCSVGCLSEMVETWNLPPLHPRLSPCHEVKGLHKNAGRKAARSMPEATEKDKVQLSIFPTVSRQQIWQGKAIPQGEL